MNVDVVGVRRIDTALVRDLLVARPGPALLPGRAAAEPAEPLPVRPLPLRHRQHRLGQVSAGRRHGAAAGPGEREPPPPDPRQPGLRHRGLLPRRPRLDLAQLPRQQRTAARSDQPGLQGRASAIPPTWGLANGICSSSSADSIGSSVLNYNLGATIRRPAFLSATTNLSVSLYTERRSEFQVYLRRETGTTVTLRREQLRRRIPLSLAYNLSYGRTEATEVSFCASFNACTATWWICCEQNRVLATLTGHGDDPAGQQRDRPLARQPQVARGDGQLPLPRLRLVPAVHPDRRRRGVVPAAVAATWCSAGTLRGGAIFSPTVDVATQRGSFIPPEHRFYAGGPNDVRGFERNELGPVVYVVSQGGGGRRGGRRTGRSARIRCRSRPPAATPSRSATSSCGCPRRCSASGSGWPPSWTPAAPGSGATATR